MPKIIINEFATNDDWAYGARRLIRTVTGMTEAQVKALWTLELSRIEYQSLTSDYEVDFTTGLISAITKFSLTCPQIVSSGVSIGDIVRIGSYHGDNKQIVCREVETINSETGAITWLQPLNPDEFLNISSLDDLIGAECSIRDLSGYLNKYCELITKIQKVAPHAKLFITQPGLSNYYDRQLWGYEIIHRKLAATYHNVDTIEITDWLYDFQKNSVDEANNVNITSTGASEYTLAKIGHWQGFEVWVNDKNIYGKDCYIQSGVGYKPNPALTGAALNISAPYNKDYRANSNMKLVFTQNVPTSGVTITVKRSPNTWSGDYCHVNSVGAFVYGQAYVQKIKEVL
jgi:hypothetical protein